MEVMELAKIKIKKVKAKPLSRKKVLANILLLPVHYQKIAMAFLDANIPARHGSLTAERKLTKEGTPWLAITKEIRKLMTIFKAYGVSYRANEVIFHCKPASGNDIYRNVKNIMKKDPILRNEVLAIAHLHNSVMPKVAVAVASSARIEH